MSSAILFSDMTPGAAWEDEFNRWYDTEHIPLRMGCPGFRSAQRYRADGETGYLAVYELDSLGALATRPYAALKQSPSELSRRMLGSVGGFTRYLGELLDDRGGDSLDAPFLYAVFFDVPPEAQPEFDAWYAEDHVPLLLNCADWLRVRRFDVPVGEPGRWNRLALHHLASRAALESPERAAARDTPWRRKLAAQPWFAARYRLYARFGERQFAAAPAPS